MLCSKNLLVAEIAFLHLSSPSLKTDQLTIQMIPENYVITRNFGAVPPSFNQECHWTAGHNANNGRTVDEWDRSEYRCYLA